MVKLSVWLAILALSVSLRPSFAQDTASSAAPPPTVAMPTPPPLADRPPPLFGPFAPLPDANPQAPLVKSVNMRLPLKVTEYLAPFDNGCAQIFAKPHDWDNKGAKWYGACPFGVANGDGVFQDKSGNMGDVKFSFGFVPNQLLFIDKHEAFQSNYENKFPVYIVLISPKVVDLKIDQGQSISFYDWPAAGATLAQSYFRIGSFACPFKAFPEKDFAPGKEQVRAAKAACALAAKLPKSGPEAIKPKYVVQQSIKLAPDYSYVPTTPQAANPVFVNIRVCSVIATGSDCAEQLQAVLAPYRPTIDAIISGREAAKEAARASYVARFKPLKDALAEKSKRLAPLMRLPRVAAEAGSPPPPSPQPQPASAK